jgi:hypothetical protein
MDKISLKKIIDFFLFPPQTPELFWFKVICSGFGIFFAVGTLIFLVKTSWIKWAFLQDIYEFITYKPYHQIGGKDKWRKIVRRFKIGVAKKIASEVKLAIIESERLILESFQKMGYKVEKFEDIFEILDPQLIPEKENLEKAHKIYVGIVEDPYFKVSVEDAKNAMLAYQKILKKFGII